MTTWSERPASFTCTRVSRRAGGDEDLDFSDALAAEHDRATGRHRPPRPRTIAMYQYRAVARYVEPLRRYVDHFGRERVRVMLLEDLARDPARLYAETCTFLGVEPSFRPRFEVVNANHVLRARRLFAPLRSARLIAAGRRVTPSLIRSRVGPGGRGNT